MSAPLVKVEMCECDQDWQETLRTISWLVHGDYSAEVGKQQAHLSAMELNRTVLAVHYQEHSCVSMHASCVFSNKTRTVLP